jgi:GH15 family glucan-1,4-alpha-glucosidase
MTEHIYAPGWPGIPARWTSSAKSGVGTSLSPASRVWFTVSHGILNEIYYPRVDQACTRDLGLIVADGRDYFFEEKRHASFAVAYRAEGVPAYSLTLRRSLRDGRVFDTPPQTVQRYQTEKKVSPYAVWRFNNKSRTMAAGKVLRIEVLARAVVHWSDDNWRTVKDADTADTGLGMYTADLPTASMHPGSTVTFTFYWPEAEKWENTNFSVNVKPGAD